MKRGEKGSTMVELVVAISIMVIIAGAAATAMFQVCGGTEHSNNSMTAVRQVHNAGYWISRDALMAQSTNTDNLTAPDFLVLNWTEWNSDNEPIYCSATYSFEDLTDGIGKLKRSYWNSDGDNRQTFIAEHIYYNPSDSQQTSKADYQDQALTVQLTAIFDETRETREYKITHRPNS